MFSSSSRTIQGSHRTCRKSIRISYPSDLPDVPDAVTSDVLSLEVSEVEILETLRFHQPHGFFGVHGPEGLEQVLHHLADEIALIAGQFAEPDSRQALLLAAQPHGLARAFRCRLSIDVNTSFTRLAFMPSPISVRLGHHGTDLAEVRGIG